MAKIRSWQILAAGSAALFAAEWGLTNIVVKPRQQLDNRDACKKELALSGLTLADWEKNWDRQDFTLKSRYGYRLRGAVIPRDPAAKPADGRIRVVVIVHGHGENLISSLKYAAIFRQLGFACIVYDQRNHGASDKALTTMGRREADDLATVCAWARKKIRQKLPAGHPRRVDGRGHRYAAQAPWTAIWPLSLRTVAIPA